MPQRDPKGVAAALIKQAIADQFDQAADADLSVIYGDPYRIIDTIAAGAADRAARELANRGLLVGSAPSLGREEFSVFSPTGNDLGDVMKEAVELLVNTGIGFCAAPDVDPTAGDQYLERQATEQIHALMLLGWTPPLHSSVEPGTETGDPMVEVSVIDTYYCGTQFSSPPDWRGVRVRAPESRVAGWIRVRDAYRAMQMEVSRLRLQALIQQPPELHGLPLVEQEPPDEPLDV